MSEVAVSGVSVIVASHRPSYAGALAERLSALIAESSVAVECLIVCDYDSALLAVQFPRMVFMNSSSLSISVKRNIGIRAAHFSVCAFIDDDCLPEPGWIQQGFEYLHGHESCVGVEGQTVMESGTGGRLADQRRLEKPAYRTNNIFYRREALVAAGLFDERFSFQREDVDLAYTLLETGVAIHAVSHIRVVHRHRPHESWDYLKNCWRRRYDPLLAKKHPDRYRAHIGSPVPKAVWVMAGALGAGCVLFFMHYFFLSIPVVAALVLSLRRAASAKSYTTLGVDTLAYLIAPIIVWAALIWGSIRYKTLLLA